MAKKVQLQDINTGEDIAPVTNIENIEGLEARLDRVKTEVKADLIGTAPDTLDTFQEVAEYIEEHKSVEIALNEAIGQKANKADVLSLEGGAMKNTNLVGNLNAQMVDGLSKENLIPTTAYNFINGYLVKTKLNINNDTFALIDIKGINFKYTSLPVNTHIELYVKKNTRELTHITAINNGSDIGKISLFIKDDVVYLWFKQPESYSSFNISVTSTKNEGELINGTNLVDSITNSSIPTEGIEGLVNITPKTNSLITWEVNDSSIKNYMPPIEQVGTLILRYNGVVEDLDTYITPKSEEIMPLPINGIEVPVEESSAEADVSAKTLDLAVGVVPLANLDEYVGTPNNWLKIYVPSAWLAKYVTRYPTLTHYFVPISGNDGSIPTNIYYNGTPGLYIELDADTSISNFITLELTGVSYGSSSYNQNVPPYFTLISFWYYPEDPAFRRYGAINLAYKGTNNESYSEIKEVTLFKYNNKICVHVPPMGWFEHISVRAFNHTQEKYKYISVTLRNAIVPTNAEYVTKVKVESSATEDYVDNALTDAVFGKEVVDETTLPELKTHTLEDIVLEPLILEWESVINRKYGGSWNRIFASYNRETKYFELDYGDGIKFTDITPEEAHNILRWGTYAERDSILDGQADDRYYSPQIRVTIPSATEAHLKFPRIGWCTKPLKVIKYLTISKSPTRYFETCSEIAIISEYLEHILDSIKPTTYPFNIANTKDVPLQSLYLLKIKGNVLANNAPMLSLESLQFWITNAANTTPITITVHPNIYAKILGVKALFTDNTFTTFNDTEYQENIARSSRYWNFVSNLYPTKALNEGIEVGDTVCIHFVASDTGKHYYQFGKVVDINEYGVNLSYFAGQEGDFDENYPNREDWMQLNQDALSKQITFATA